MEKMRWKFELGTVVATIRANWSLPDDELWELLDHHREGEWFDQEHGEALREGGRIISHPKTEDCRYSIVTEGDRSKTTLMLQNEFISKDWEKMETEEVFAQEEEE